MNDPAFSLYIYRYPINSRKSYFVYLTLWQLGTCSKIIASSLVIGNEGSSIILLLSEIVSEKNIKNYK